MRSFRHVLGCSLLLCSNIFCADALLHYEVVSDQNTLKISSPALSMRKTLKIRLDNGLEAYIVSDPEANSSAAALCVGAGSWHEPEEYPGLAHFCEHMLFMGSEKYPNENLFSMKVNDAGGMTNAYTDSLITNYMFSSNHGSFNEILDIFAQFFISPLFKQDAVKRELLAVNQEYEKNIPHDGWREWMIIKETARSDHPVSRFNIGTEETLSIIPLDVLKTWHHAYYSPSNMHLAVYTNQDVESIAPILAEIFSKIPNVAAPKELASEPILSLGQKGHIAYIKPLKEIQKITFIWEVPAEFSLDMNAKIPELIAYALSYKGERSLFETLKAKHLAEDLSASCDRAHHFLEFTISLTKEGVGALDEVIQLTFEAIGQLKEGGIPVYLFNEYRKMQELEYTWQSKPNEFQYVSSIAAQMQYEPLASFPQKTISLFSYKPHETKEVLKKLSPQETFFCVTASPDLTKQNYDRKERWLGGEYSLVKIDEDKLNLWSSASSKQAHLLPSQFIPSDLSLITTVQGKELFEPKLLADDFYGKCYFMQDQFYLVPKGYIDVGIRSPLISDTPRNLVLTDLFTLYLDHKFSSLLASASRGGLEGSFYQNDFKLHVHIQGYNEKMGLLLTHIFDGLKTASYSKETFEMHKESLLNAYGNKDKNLSFFQAKDTFLHLIFNDSLTGSTLCKTLANITYDDFVSFGNHLFDEAFLEMIAYGNLEETYVQKLYGEIKTALSPTIHSSKDHIHKKVLDFAKTNGPTTIQVANPFAGDAALLSLGFGKMSYEKLATQRILSQVISESFYNTLRTKQQTGYMTHSFPLESHGLLSQIFIVHSTTHYSEELLARFELFVETFNRKLKDEIPEDRFCKIKETLIEKASKSPQNFAKKGSELAFLAFSEEGNFLKRLKLIEALQNLSYTDFINLSSSVLDRKNKERVAVLVSGGEEKTFSYTQTTPEALRALQF